MPNPPVPTSGDHARDTSATPRSAMPPLTPEARNRATEIVTQFETDLKDIAAMIARNGEAETIIVAHVTQAHQTLKHAGLKSQATPAFYMRPDFWVGVGTLLMGFSPTIASFSKDIIESGGDSISKHPIPMWAFVIVLPCIAFGVGAFLTGCGWRHAGRDSV
jgi:hypothetical protein